MRQNFDEISVLGVDFIRATNGEFLKQIYADSRAGKNRFVVTANPEIVLHARQDHKFAQVLAKADYTTADGIGIIIGSSILNDPLPERITGFDTMTTLLKWADTENKRVFLLGAKPAVIKATVNKVKQQYPHLTICGWHDGYYKDEKQVANEIKAAHPDFVFAALGFPKQEYFIAANRQVADAIWMGVGGSFDVLANFTKRAPQKWRDHHLEWLYRLLKEPYRIGRMMSLPKYLILICRQRITGKK